MFITLNSIKAFESVLCRVESRRTNDNILTTYSGCADPVRFIRARANGCIFRSDRRRP